MRVCAPCIGDKDLRTWIKKQSEDPGCDFCRRRDAPTVSIDSLAEFMRECMERAWGYAVEQLPYESREGGYQGVTWTTWELLFDVIGIEFPRDKDDKLAYALVDRITEESWCDFDWLSLDEDDVYLSSWEDFCHIVKHERRFFFGAIEQDQNDRDRLAPSVLLDKIAELSRDLGLIKVMPIGTHIYRARASDTPLKTPTQLGPPPPESALQSNRMNPPGVPMLYAAETPKVAVAEIRKKDAYVGTFEILRDRAILDLVDLPEVPGIFSGVERWKRLGLSFLNSFQREIVKPVDRDERTHIDYIPTQIISEYFRFHATESFRCDGIRYPSNVTKGGRNIVLFATQRDVECAEVSLECETTGHELTLRLIAVRHHRTRELH